MAGSDHRRIKLLLRQAGWRADAGNYQAVYALALEVAHMCRLRVLGLTEAHPVLPSARRLSELPPGLEDPDPDG